MRLNATVDGLEKRPLALEQRAAVRTRLDVRTKFGLTRGTERARYGVAQPTLVSLAIHRNLSASCFLAA